MRDAIPLEDQKELAGRWIERGRNGTEFDYAELPLLTKLADKHWTNVLGPFFVHCSSSRKTALREPDFLKLIAGLIPIRNKAAHPTGLGPLLNTQEQRHASDVYERVLEWQTALRSYVPRKPE